MAAAFDAEDRRQNFQEFGRLGRFRYTVFDAKFATSVGNIDLARRGQRDHGILRLRVAFQPLGQIEAHAARRTHVDHDRGKSAVRGASGLQGVER